MKDFNGTGNGGGSQTELTALIAKAFGGKSEGQMWRSIIAQAEKGKRDGTLTNKQLDDFYAAASPMLDGVKRQRLKRVIEKLKAI